MKSFDVKKDSATPGLIASEQNRVVTLDFLEINQPGGLDTAFLAHIGEHLAQVHHSQSLAHGSEICQAGNEHETLQFAEMDRVTEFGQTRLWYLVTLCESLRAIPLVRGPQ